VADLKPLPLSESSLTPGGIDGLELWQTTRLRAQARLGDATVDCSELAVRWESSLPQEVSVSQAGLVQRRRGDAAVQIQAGIPGGPQWEAFTVR
jgi:hypothetical protein